MIKIKKDGTAVKISVDNKEYVPQIIKVLLERGQVYVPESKTPESTEFNCVFYRSSYSPDLFVSTLYKDLSSIPFKSTQHELPDCVMIENCLGTRIIKPMEYVEYKQTFVTALNYYVDYDLTYSNGKMILDLWGTDVHEAKRILSSNVVKIPRELVREDKVAFTEKVETRKYMTLTTYYKNDDYWYTNIKFNSLSLEQIKLLINTYCLMYIEDDDSWNINYDYDSHDYEDGVTYESVLGIANDIEELLSKHDNNN